MLKKIIFCLGIFISLFSFANNGLQYYKVKFPKGITKLTKTVMKQASDIYNSLPERNYTRIRIVGEGEDGWSKFDKIQLAKKRAYSVRSFFVGIGCASKNVKLDLSGSVSLLLFKPKAVYSVSGQINLKKIEQQCFTINSSESSYFKTKSGNIFVFQPNSFISDNGFPVTGNVNICVWEFFKQKDMIVSELTSGGKDKVLETASTFYIQGYKDEMKLEVQNGKSYKIYLNRPEDADGFKAYYGSVNNGNVTWLEDKRSYAYTSVFDEGKLMEKLKKNNNIIKVRSNEEGKEKMLEKKLLLTGKRIGWINCDRIVHVKNPSELKVILDEAVEEFTVRLALDKRNAVIPGLSNSNYVNHYKLTKIPSGESGHVIAYRETEGGYMVAYSQVTIGFIKSLNLKPLFKTKEEFESLLDSFLN